MLSSSRREMFKAMILAEAEFVKKRDAARAAKTVFEQRVAELAAADQKMTDSRCRVEEEFGIKLMPALLPTGDDDGTAEPPST